MYTRPHATLEHILPFTLTPSLILPILAAALGLVMLIVALSITRSRAQQRALRRRVAYDVLPPTSFDPRSEDVHRYARLLQRVAATGRGRHAVGVRIRLHTGPDGRLTYRVEGPRTVATLTQQAYASVELRAATSAAASSPPDEPDPTAIAPAPDSDTTTNGETS